MPQRRFWMPKKAGILLLVLIANMFLNCHLVLSNTEVATTTISKKSWAKFIKASEPVLNPQWHVAGDASVIKFRNKYLMYYSCIDKSDDHLTICLATSLDGYSWARFKNGNKTEGRILKHHTTWSDAEETSFAFKVGDYILLWFAGYHHKPGSFNYPSYFGIAASADGANFYYPVPHPILAPTAGSLDEDAIYSPSVISHKGMYYMIYSGFCFSSAKCQVKKDKVSILGATSTDVVHYKKRAKPVLEAQSGLPWMNKGVAEADLVQGPDKYFYLFFTAIDDSDRKRIGVARSVSPFGPWEVNPLPILETSVGDAFDNKEVVAPSVLIENDKVRLWYSGFQTSGYIRIGYAEATWPLVDEAYIMPDERMPTR
jgi:predicted GH43/DUF377 family glycosyl hydrolase